jgi:hypothetical protein
MINWGVVCVHSVVISKRGDTLQAGGWGARGSQCSNIVGHSGSKMGGGGMTIVW